MWGQDRSQTRIHMRQSLIDRSGSLADLSVISRRVIRRDLIRIGRDLIQIGRDLIRIGRKTSLICRDLSVIRWYLIRIDWHMSLVRRDLSEQRRLGRGFQGYNPPSLVLLGAILRVRLFARQTGETPHLMVLQSVPAETNSSFG